MDEVHNTLTMLAIAAWIAYQVRADSILISTGSDTLQRRSALLVGAVMTLASVPVAIEYYGVVLGSIAGVLAGVMTAGLFRLLRIHFNEAMLRSHIYRAVQLKDPVDLIVRWVLFPAWVCAMVIFLLGYTFSHGTDSTLAYYIISVVFVPAMAFVTLDEIRRTLAKHREERIENHHSDDE